MQTYPSRISIKAIASYTDEETGIIITVSRRSGGIGADDYLVSGTNGFSATRNTRDKAIDIAQIELARIRKMKHDG